MATIDDVRAALKNLDALWFVTKPTRASELGDVLFCSTWRDLALQFKGGLDPAEIVGAFVAENDARTLAEKLIADRDEAEKRESDLEAAEAVEEAEAARERAVAISTMSDADLQTVIKIATPDAPALVDEVRAELARRVARMTSNAIAAHERAIEVEATLTAPQAKAIELLRKGWRVTWDRSGENAGYGSPTCCASKGGSVYPLSPATLSALVRLGLVVSSDLAPFVLRYTLAK